MSHDTLLVHGGRPLHGSVEVTGSKNGALALLSAVLLAESPVTLDNSPDIADLRAKVSLLERFGVASHRTGNLLHLDPTILTHVTPDEETVRSIRTSFFLLGPLLARNGRASISAPGGCKIGARPVDFHIKGLRAMGAEIEFVGGVYQATAKKLRGATIYLDSPSPGATNHLMATATRAEGTTIIQNAAMEPEVIALAEFLSRMGANVTGAGTSTITIQGVDRLDGCRMRVPADRMQAGTYLIAGAATKGDVTVTGVQPIDLVAVTNKLRETGCTVDETADSIRVRATERPLPIRFRTMPHPGFPTDMQQPMTALLATGQGTSLLEETIYENRIGHVDELNRMGANIFHQGQSFVINGVPRLAGATVEATDLRAGAALVVAGLSAEGETIIREVRHIDRGYQNLEANLVRLGADVIRRTADGEPLH